VLPLAPVGAVRDVSERVKCGGPCHGHGTWRDGKTRPVPTPMVPSRGPRRCHPSS